MSNEEITQQQQVPPGTPKAPVANTTAKNESSTPASSGQESPKWTIAGKPRQAPKWRGGGNRGRGAARGRGGALANGSNRSEGNPQRGAYGGKAQAAATSAAPAVHRTRGRDSSRRASVSSAHSGEDSNDSGASSGDESGRSPSPPPAVPLTFWTPMVFLCPMPDCPPTTEPTTNPMVALDHLRTAHSIEVKNAHHVLPYLDKYIDHCAKHAHEHDGKPVFVLGEESDLEDKAFREKLQREKLNQMLKIQEKERLEDSTVSRKCLFCKVLCENRSLLFKHMFSEHGFNIGLPDNLVEVSDFLETLQKKLAGLQCLYCEKIFKTSAVLRKHMRKKKHFKINPRNRGYDRFYIINYLEPGKNWESFENEKYESDEDRREEEWEDWNDEDGTEDSTMCLFDENVFPSAEEAYEHMRDAHAFDLRKIRAERGLDFYESIKLINFIRKQTSLCSCYACGASFDSIDQVTVHMTEKSHFANIPGKDADFWKDPQYLFPCYENDPLLMFDVADGDSDEGSEPDIASGQDELRRVAISERNKADSRSDRALKIAEEDARRAGLESDESECDVVVLGVSEVTLNSPETPLPTTVTEGPK
ncbi:hypothetical protein HKX48_002425 [Thoreauomyces humboldtii]|nr:hypothetical protein HKX48_002425 [Thoreauomyces humboldtii]